MSWDFSMTIDAGGEFPIDLPYEANYTYNVSAMFFEAFPGKDGIRGLDGRTGEDCQEPLRVAIQAMEDNPGKYKTMNPDNGWGDYHGALDLLRELRGWCVAAPNATMAVH